MFMHFKVTDESNICSGRYITTQPELFMPMNRAISRDNVFKNGKQISDAISRINLSRVFNKNTSFDDCLFQKFPKKQDTAW